MTDATRTRRPPPPFRRCAVRAVTAVTPRLTRVTLAGAELVGFPEPEPAGSVRLLLPDAGLTDAGRLEIPTWAGNNFVLADGRRPTLRTLTPVGTDPARGELGLEIVRHGGGRASDWAAAVGPGAECAISGPARGYVPPPGATRFVFGGDETAIPALRQLAAAAPPGVPVDLYVEVADPSARVGFPVGDHVSVHWVDGAGATPGAALADTLTDALTEDTVDPGTHVWAGGEAAAMQRIRRHLYETLDVERSRATMRGYWKHGRSAGTDE